MFIAEAETPEVLDEEIKIKERLSRLRARMKSEGIDAYYIPSADPHNNEYVPPCWKRREFISGFTGSAGDVAVTLDDGGLWTDGRYFLQAEEQLQGSGLALFKMGERGVPKIEEWVAEKCSKGQSLGLDPQLVSIDTAEKFKKALDKNGSELKFIEENLVDAVWENRPELTFSQLEIVSNKIAGKTVKEKLQMVRRKMAEKKCSCHLISALDSIAWLFNLRGSDIDFNRVFVAYAAVTDQKAFLFIEPDRLTAEIRKHLEGEVQIQSYVEVASFLQNLNPRDGQLWLDPKQTSKWLEVQVSESIPVHKDSSPVSGLKAVKNSTELQGFRDCHLSDGVAMVRFLIWMEEAIPKGGVTECSLADKLLEFRKQNDGFCACSFPTIAGYRGHGAVIHYTASAETDFEIKEEGIFLLDSGGHYETGTTDITRTLAMGEPTDEQKDVFTRVLKGLIGLSALVFPKGFTGKQLELPARKALWDSGRNFNHGTGHGVGHSLNVHEGPVYFSPKAPEIPLEVGHVLSNEPGFYQTGEFGMRIENLMIVRKDEKLSSMGNGDFLGFETITFCPIDLNLVEANLLSSEEKAWLNAYHQEVYEKLSPALNEVEKAWLKGATRPL